MDTSHAKNENISLELFVLLIRTVYFLRSVDGSIQSGQWTDLYNQLTTLS